MTTTENVAGANWVLLGLGANVAGCWGSPRETLRRSIRELRAAGLHILRASRIYSTTPWGHGSQPRFSNAVVLATSAGSPAHLLRVAKGIERRAGRRLTARWGPRALDIDILDYGGRRYGWPPPTHRQGRVVLPHPELHRRAFVLVPLLEVAPHWVHPVFGISGHALLARLSGRRPADVRQTLDFIGSACDKSAK